MQNLPSALWLLAIASLSGCSAGAPDASDERVADDQAALRIGGVCGGPRNRSCDDDEYCRTLRPGRCPGPRAVGVCLSRPEVCTRIFDPVCGCDGQTYGNRCEANAAGVPVEHAGECVPEENPCAAVLCLVGSQCVVVSGEPVCVPNAPQQCGDTTCRAGTVCCNASCGICTPPGGACIQIACE